MDQEIHLSPSGLERVKAGIHRGVIGHVGGDHEGLAGQAFDQRPHAFFQLFALIGESQLSALCGELLGNTPGNRVLVGHAHDKPALALHQITGRKNAVAHGVSPSRNI